MSENMPAEPGDSVQVSELIVRETAKGKSKTDIVTELMKRGWSEESAVVLVNTVVKAVEEHKPLPIQKGFWQDTVSTDTHRELENLAEAVRKELAEGKSKAKIAKELVTKGWTEESAIRLVSGAAQTEELRSLKKPISERQRVAGNSIQMILWGITLVVVGFVVFQVSSSSVWMIIGWASMLFGGVTVWNGLSAWWKSRK